MSQNGSVQSLFPATTARKGKGRGKKNNDNGAQQMANMLQGLMQLSVSNGKQEQKERKPKGERPKYQFAAILLGIKDGQLFQGVVPKTDLNQYLFIANANGLGYRMVPSRTKNVSTMEKGQEYIQKFIDGKLTGNHVEEMNAQIHRDSELARVNPMFPYSWNFMLSVTSTPGKSNKRFAVGIHIIRLNSAGQEDHKFQSILIPVEYQKYGMETASNYSALLFAMCYVMCKFIPAIYQSSPQRLHGANIAIGVNNSVVVKTVTQHAKSWDMNSWTTKSGAPVSNPMLISNVLGCLGYNPTVQLPYTFHVKLTNETVSTIPAALARMAMERSVPNGAPLNEELVKSVTETELRAKLQSMKSGFQAVTSADPFDFAMPEPDFSTIAPGAGVGPSQTVMAAPQHNFAAAPAPGPLMPATFQQP